MADDDRGLTYPVRFILEEAENGWVVIVPAKDFDLYYEKQYVCESLAKLPDLIGQLLDD